MFGLFMNSSSMKSAKYSKYFCKVFQGSVSTMSNPCSRLIRTPSMPYCQSAKSDKFIQFEKMLETRRLEAKRSVLVQVHSEQSCKQLYDYCTSFGAVNKMLHYAVSDLNFVIVEFKDRDSATSVINKSGHLDVSQIVPVRSPFLWFRSNGKDVKRKQKSVDNVEIENFTKSGVVSPPGPKEITSWLLTAQSITEQMQILEKALSLDDLGVRMRFLTASQIESIISGIFPNGRVLPFGSTVNGFGKIGCDLDIVMQLDAQTQPAVEDSRLIFQSKTSLVNGRTQQQRYIESVGDFIERYLPGCSDVKRILQARVPILKYRQEYTGVDCDLSLTNLTGVYMAEILYMFSSMDSRVRPLVYAIRYWAQVINLTNPTPGRWITNFSMSLLVLFYLQQAKILPPLDTLCKLSRQEDSRFAEDVNCTFLRDISQLPNEQTNTSSLTDLLKGFFEYYSLFDFDSQAISLRKGKPLPKQEYSALYIVNPLESHLNVSKNVSAEEMGRIKIEICNAARYLDREDITGRDNREDWGLVTLFQSSHYASRKDVFSAIQKHQAGANRLVTVTDLFNDDGEEVIKFKNPDVNTKRLVTHNRKQRQR